MNFIKKSSNASCHFTNQSTNIQTNISNIYSNTSHITNTTHINSPIKLVKHQRFRSLNDHIEKQNLFDKAISVKKQPLRKVQKKFNQIQEFINKSMEDLVALLIIPDQKKGALSYHEQGLIQHREFNWIKYNIICCILSEWNKLQQLMILMQTQMKDIINITKQQNKASKNISQDINYQLDEFIDYKVKIQEKNNQNQNVPVEFKKIYPKLFSMFPLEQARQMKALIFINSDKNTFIQKKKQFYQIKILEQRNLLYHIGQRINYVNLNLMEYCRKIILIKQNKIIDQIIQLINKTKPAEIILNRQLHLTIVEKVQQIQKYIQKRINNYHFLRKNYETLGKNAIMQIKEHSQFIQKIKKYDGLINIDWEQTIKSKNQKSIGKHEAQRDKLLKALPSISKQQEFRESQTQNFQLNSFFYQQHSKYVKSFKDIDLNQNLKQHELEGYSLQNSANFHLQQQRNFSLQKDRKSIQLQNFHGNKQTKLQKRSTPLTTKNLINDYSRNKSEINLHNNYQKMSRFASDSKFGNNLNQRKLKKKTSQFKQSIENIIDEEKQYKQQNEILLANQMHFDKQISSKAQSRQSKLISPQSQLLHLLNNIDDQLNEYDQNKYLLKQKRSSKIGYARGNRKGLKIIQNQKKQKKLLIDEERDPADQNYMKSSNKIYKKQGKYLSSFKSQANFKSQSNLNFNSSTEKNVDINGRGNRRLKTIKKNGELGNVMRPSISLYANPQPSSNQKQIRRIKLQNLSTFHKKIIGSILQQTPEELMKTQNDSGGSKNVIQMKDKFVNCFYKLLKSGALEQGQLSKYKRRVENILNNESNKKERTLSNSNATKSISVWQEYKHLGQNSNNFAVNFKLRYGKNNIYEILNQLQDFASKNHLRANMQKNEQAWANLSQIKYMFEQQKNGMVQQNNRLGIHLQINDIEDEEFDNKSNTSDEINQKCGILNEKVQRQFSIQQDNFLIQYMKRLLQVELLTKLGQKEA